MNRKILIFLTTVLAISVMSMFVAPTFAKPNQIAITFISSTKGGSVSNLAVTLNLYVSGSSLPANILTRTTECPWQN